MEAITKILTLIPDNWDDVLAQSQRFEENIESAHEFVSGQQATIDDFVSKVVAFIAIDWTNVSHWLSSTQFYQHLEDITLDIPALLAVPNDMDWGNSTQIDAFIAAKFELLKTSLSGLNIERKTGGSVDTTLALEQLKTVVNGVREVSADIDFVEPESVALFRSRMTDSVRPAMLALIDTVFGVDLSVSTTDTGAQSLFSLPQKIQAAQPEPPETFDPELTSQVRSSLEMLSKAKHALPVLQQELASVTSAQNPLDGFLAGSEDFVVHLQAHLPALADALSTIFNGQDWQDVNFEQLKSDIEQLCALVAIYLQTSPITEALRTFIDVGEGASPVRLVGFEETWSTEQKLTQLVTDLAAIVRLPSDFAELAPEAFVTLIKSKVDRFAEVVNHVQLFGFTADAVYQRVKTPLERLFATDDADLSSPEGITAFIFDKVILLANLLSSANGSSGTTEPAEGATTDGSTEAADGEATENSEQSTQSNGGILARFANAGGNFVQVLCQLIAELVEKTKLIWLFVKNNNLGLSLNDQDESFAPVALQPTNYQVNAGAAAEPDDTNENPPHSGSSTPDNSTPSDSSTSSGSSGSATDSSPTIPDESSEPDVTKPSIREVISLEMVIRNLLGDRDSGVISFLPTPAQDVMLGILNGEYLQKLTDDLTEMWESTGVKPQFEAQYQAWLALKVPQTDDNGEPVLRTAASLVSQLVAGIDLIYNAGIAFAGQAITLLVDIIFEVVNVLFGVVKAFKVPSQLRRALPHQIEEALLGAHNPNLLCLIAAIPTVILTGFLTVPVDTINSWIAQAA